MVRVFGTLETFAKTRKKEGRLNNDITTLRARPNGEQQNLKTKPKTKRTDFSFFGENEDGVQTQDTRDKQKLQKRTRVNGRDGAPALMQRPAAIEAAPSPEKRGECSHTASRPYSAAARRPVS